ncbi:MAG: hypothetical protein MUD17_07135 [Gemmatimonadaceae bacterium]|jgi:hypothetical protein|nr:hypothetical protein [Gemmatimonadaceae bacterium]
MSPLLQRSSRLIRRVALGGLACLAVLFAASLAGPADARAAVTEEVSVEIGESLDRLLAAVDQASDGPDALLLPFPTPGVLASRHTPRRPTARLASPARAPWRAHAAARGPPARA